MATISVNATENEGVSGSTKSTWNFIIEGINIVVADEDFVIPLPSMKAKYSGTNKGYASFQYELYPHDFGIKRNNDSIVRVLTSSGRSSLWYRCPNDWSRISWANGITKDIPLYWGQEDLKTLRVSDIFDSTNKTTTKLDLIVDQKGTLNATTAQSATEPTNYSYWNSTVDHPDFVPNNIMSNVILDKPPTATVDPLSKNTNDYYAKSGNVPVTTVSVSIRDLTAYYGADFTTTTDNPAGVKFEIGAQSDEAHPQKTDTIDTYHARFADTSLSIDLDTVGTFTPKVTVTDSRGQTYVKTFDPITVQNYNPTTNITTLLRVNATGEPEEDPKPGRFSDEGTNAVVACVFDYPTIENNYMKPPLVKIDGQSPTNEVDWYTSWTESGGFSGPITFSSYNPTRPVTLYGKIVDTLQTDQSYEISVACDTTLDSGSADSQVLPQAFYLLSAAAGGHGLGIGMKVPEDPDTNRKEGLHVDMDATFYKNFKVRQAPGIIKMYAGNSAPDGWLLCDGSAVSRTDYSLLYAVIGTTYGSGDGSTTFNIPDLRGRFPVGAGVNYNVGSTGGSEDSIVPYHNHHVDAISSGAQWASLTGSAKALGWSTATASGIISITSPTNDRTASSGKNFGHRYYNIDASHAHTVAAHDTNYAGTSGEEVGANMPPYVGVNYIISTGEPSGWSGDSSDTIVRGVLVDGQSVVNGQGIAEVCETETNGIWTYRKWPNGKLEAWGTKTGTLSNYSTWNNMNGYYFNAVPTPITMIDQNYNVFGDWMIGSGFAWHATTLNKSTTSFNIYALSSATGSQSCYVDMYLYGRWK